MRKYLLLLPLLVLCGCHSHLFYQESAVESARKYIFENARELTPEQYGFIRYTAPVLLTGDILGRNSANSVAKSIKGNERMQICITWKVPELETVYMVYGVSGSMMRDWYPARLIRRRINTLDKKALAVLNTARNYAVNSLHSELSAAELNKIRFSHPEMVQSSFELSDNRAQLIKGDNGSGDKVIPMPWQKVVLKKDAGDGEEVKDENSVQISLVWSLENGRKAVFCGVGKADLSAWDIKMGGVLSEKELKGAVVKVLKNSAGFLFASPDQKVNAKGGK